jgi:hypothetical protein
VIGGEIQRLMKIPPVAVAVFLAFRGWFKPIDRMETTTDVRALKL